MVGFAVDINRRMMNLRSTSLQCGRRIQLRLDNPISSSTQHGKVLSRRHIGCSVEDKALPPLTNLSVLAYEK